MTFSESAPSVRHPAGANIVLASFSPGTGEPQVRQNHLCQSVPGLFQVVMRSSPRIQRNRSLGNTTTAMPLLPVERRDRCDAEYDQARSGWHRLLKPYSRVRGGQTFWPD